MAHTSVINYMGNFSIINLENLHFDLKFGLADMKRYPENCSEEILKLKLEQNINSKAEIEIASNSQY